MEKKEKENPFRNWQMLSYDKRSNIIIKEKILKIKRKKEKTHRTFGTHRRRHATRTRVVRHSRDTYLLVFRIILNFNFCF